MSDNPLKQYFRRPAVYLKLPSGGSGYPPEALDLPESGEIPIYPMTAIDEITSRTPDALYNGTAVMEIIKSCAPNIRDPWYVTNVDLDPILVAIRAATHGGTMEIETECPECKEPAKYDVNLAGILAEFNPGDYKNPLNIDGIVIKFKPLRYSEMNQTTITQFEVQRGLMELTNIEDQELKNQKTSNLLLHINEMTMTVVASTIEYVKVPDATVMDQTFILEFLKNVEKKVYSEIQNYSIKLRQSTENKPLKIKCMHCSHEYEQTFSVNVSDFFG